MAALRPFSVEGEHFQLTLSSHHQFIHGLSRELALFENSKLFSLSLYLYSDCLYANL
jgi:hypothetical protein